MQAKERTEIFNLYIDFLSVCLKTYEYAADIIDIEVKKFTKGELEDGWLFFLLMFSHGANVDKAKNLEKLKEYLNDIGEESMDLTPKGRELMEFLDKKIELHSSVLRFNGVSLYDLITDINCMTKMMSFWKVILKR
ncbi:hypothetical protein [Alphaproteobacteria bacterium endosymbiont of Tiliacea citrago]|uniref:hypothetical protein n=1 Tax=Alphaproteobacteria bacterium endosymbiont of Tiliacea citrago TaxID=3077944 RepID=UPI00313D66CF